VTFVPADPIKFMLGRAKLGQSSQDLEAKAEGLQAKAADIHFQSQMMGIFGGHSAI